MKVGIEPFYVELGRRIQQFRTAKKLSQEELGQELQPQVTRASIANLETGKQRVLVLTLVQLAKALGVTLQDLVPDPGEKSSVSLTQVQMRQELEKELSELSKTQIRRLAARLQPKDRRENR